LPTIIFQRCEAEKTLKILVEQVQFRSTGQTVRGEKEVCCNGRIIQGMEHIRTLGILTRVRQFNSLAHYGSQMFHAFETLKEASLLLSHLCLTLVSCRRIKKKFDPNLWCNLSTFFFKNMIEAAIQDIHEYRKGEDVGNPELFVHLSESPNPLIKAFVTVLARWAKSSQLL